jgi:glyoxylase-like metal-dependent hydrolase (beta-lactamase superfamily II)
LTFRDGAELAPGVRAMLAAGHTVGHSMIRVSSQGSELLLWGDIVHNAALQFPEPDRAIAFDTNQPMAIASRKRVLDMVTTDRLTIAGSHLPFPGIGHVAKASVGYAYVPIQWGADLLGKAQAARIDGRPAECVPASLRSVETRPGQRLPRCPASRYNSRWLEGARSACADTDKRGRRLVPLLQAREARRVRPKTGVPPG